MYTQKLEINEMQLEKCWTLFTVYRLWHLHVWDAIK